MLLSRDSENLKISHVLEKLDYLQYLPQNSLPSLNQLLNHSTLYLIVYKLCQCWISVPNANNFT